MLDMDETRKSMTLALVFGFIISVLAGAVIISEILSTEEIRFTMLFILIIIICFFGSTYWIYHQIEYDRKKWGGEKRTWYSWLWYPSRRLGESYYWGGITRVTMGVPFLVYFWVVFIIGYSMGAGLLLAILSFLLIMFTIHELHHWFEKKELSLNDDTDQSQRLTRLVIPLLFIVLLLVIFSLPYIEGEPKGNYEVNSNEQCYIGTWSNSDITFIFEKDHTCVATYQNTKYYGIWHYEMFSATITWSNILELPHPNKPSYLYPIEQVYLINGKSSLSLYTPFEAPAYLTLNKVS